MKGVKITTLRKTIESAHEYGLEVTGKSRARMLDYIAILEGIQKGKTAEQIANTIDRYTKESIQSYLSKWGLSVFDKEHVQKTLDCFKKIVELYNKEIEGSKKAIELTKKNKKLILGLLLDLENYKNNK